MDTEDVRFFLVICGMLAVIIVAGWYAESSGANDWVNTAIHDWLDRVELRYQDVSHG